MQDSFFAKQGKFEFYLCKLVRSDQCLLVLDCMIVQ